MSLKRIVISGSPGAGKTSIIRVLSKKGYPVFEEFSRSLIVHGKEKGIENAFFSDPQLFSEELFAGREAQYYTQLPSHNKMHLPVVFYDRGVHDIFAYLMAIGHETKEWKPRIQNLNYDLVFLVEPWEAIYKQDEQRLETFEQAQFYYPFIESVYKERHKVIVVPKDNIANRVAFIESFLQQHEF